MTFGAPVMASGFLAGLTHPLTVTTHAVALLGLGLMIGQQLHRRVTLAAFALGLFAGLAALATGVGETPAQIVILLGAAGLGAASGRPVRELLGAPLALIVGAAVGLDSPPQATSIPTANAALVGTALAGFVTVALITADSARLREGWRHIGVRVFGSWIAVSAILVLALRLAR